MSRLLTSVDAQEGYLAKAVAAGITKESAITASVHRTFMQKMKVGLFDPEEDSPWTDVGLDDLNSTYSQGVAYEAALQGSKFTHNLPFVACDVWVHLMTDCLCVQWSS